jgi:hypothetical protein
MCITMAVTEVRAFPVNATIVMRSALFALANQGANLQVYNEESGIIVATVSRWLGLQKKEVVARVRSLENTCQLELDAPDVEKARELLQLISTYVRDGARVQANATIQWVDLQRQQASKAKRRELSDRARNLLTGSTTAPPPPLEAEAPSSAVAVLENDPAQIVAFNSNDPVPIPDNPGVLVKNRENMMIELKVDPLIFSDRSGYLNICSICYSPSLRGSAFCPNCGRPLTLEAVQPEMRHNAERSANSGLTAGLIGLLLNVIPLLILVLPALLSPEDASLLDRIRGFLSPLTITLTFVLGILPAIGAGWFALRQGQRAVWYLNLPAVLDNNGRTKASIGNALGWLSIYLGIGWGLLIVIALL